MSKPATEDKDKVVACIYCQQVVIIPGFVKPCQIWIGVCAQGHRALYSYPPPPAKKS